MHYVEFTSSDLNSSNVLNKSLLQLGLTSQKEVKLFDNNDTEITSVSGIWNSGIFSIDLTSLVPISGTWKLGVDIEETSQFTEVSTKVNYNALINQFVICENPELKIKLPTVASNNSQVKVASPKYGSVSVVAPTGKTVNGLSEFSLSPNMAAKFTLNETTSNWEVSELAIYKETDPEDVNTDYIVHQSNIKTREEFKSWILRKLGFPLVSVELTDEQLDDAINDALIEFGEYAFQEEKFFAVDISAYQKGIGVELPNGVVAVNRVVSNLVGPNAIGAGKMDNYMNDLVANGAIGFPMLGRPAGCGWVNYEMAMAYLDLSQKMLGGDYDYSYNNRSRMLTLYPDPVAAEQKTGWITCFCSCVRDDENQFGEVWVKKMALALAKITLGEVRGKFKGISLPAGGSLTDDDRVTGENERESARTELRERYPAATIFAY